eukprot:2490508-Amphidinium_carterae.2
MQGGHRPPKPWETPFMTMVRKGMPISALLPAVGDGGDAAGPPYEAPPREVWSSCEPPAKHTQVGIVAESSIMLKDMLHFRATKVSRVLTWWRARGCCSRPFRDLQYSRRCHGGDSHSNANQQAWSATSAVPIAATAILCGRTCTWGCAALEQH